MRVLSIVWLAGCSYTSPSALAPGPGDAPPNGDAPAIDAPAAPDAPIDASSKCLAAATDTSPAGHHYFLTADGSFAASQVECGTNDAHLVKIEDETEDDFLTAAFNLGSSRFAWIGLSDPTDLDVYVWTDGDPLLIDYNGFSGGVVPGDPDNNCVDSNGVWQVFGCGATNHGGICECE